jgi:hypothetical protein
MESDPDAACVRVACMRSAMFFRFGAALSLVVLVALAGTSLEKQILQLKRGISHQQYRQDELFDQQIRLRLEAQRLGTPTRLLGPLERGELSLLHPSSPRLTDPRQRSHLQWTSRTKSVGPR